MTGKVGEGTWGEVIQGWSGLRTEAGGSYSVRVALLFCSESMKGDLSEVRFLWRRHTEGVCLPESRDLQRMTLQLKQPWMLALDKATSPPSSTTEKLCDLRQVTESESVCSPLSEEITISLPGILVRWVEKARTWRVLCQVPGTPQPRC